jgi:hypothetical protein
VALSVGTAKHDAGKAAKKKGGGATKVESRDAKQGQEQAAGVTELSKAAKKNLKRKQKRESSRVAALVNEAQA